MAKRYTDTTKWLNPWFRKLPPAFRELWNYILDTCDHAGIWRVDLDMATMIFGNGFTEHQCFEFFKGRVIRIDYDKWFIPSFISFQYGELNSTNRAHASVIKLLIKHGIDPVTLDPSSTLNDPYIEAKDKDKDKDKEQDKDKEKEKENAGEEKLSHEIGKLKSSALSVLHHRAVTELPAAPFNPHELLALVSEWGKTLEHFKIAKNPKLDEFQIGNLLIRHGAEQTRLALIGARFEEGTNTFSPAKHLSITRLSRPDQFAKCVNLGAQDHSSPNVVKHDYSHLEEA